MDIRVLSEEEKEAILKTLESDRRFRYALMGLLGFSEILDRITRLEEGQQRIGERIVELEERQQKLEERFAKLEERFVRVEEELVDLRKTVITIGNRFGVLADDVFRRALAGILRRYFGADARRWVKFDSEGIVYGYPAVVEIDVVIKDAVHILVETKSRADWGDVILLLNKAVLGFTINLNTSKY